MSEIDWQPVIDLVNEYIEEVHDPDTNSDRLAKFPDKIFEAAAEAVKGSDIWDEINPILAEM